ncbi:MAG: PIN domain-containing protein [Deltaproteobacteria bacterium]|nr:PIN domain-containing protein [Deltaproteobacteria bacterium]
MTLIDTCVWINFLRGRDLPHVRLLEGLLEEGEACLCEVTFAEICFGARGSRQFKKYEHDFSQIPLLKLPDNWHRELARMGYELQRHGHRPFMADLQIALTAVTHDADLLTTDKDFIPYQSLVGLRLG